MKRLISWITPAYWFGIIIYFMGSFMWGSLGAIRPDTIQDGKIDAEYAINLIGDCTVQFRSLYILLCLGFVLSVVVNVMSKNNN